MFAHNQTPLDLLISGFLLSLCLPLILPLFPIPQRRRLQEFFQESFVHTDQFRVRAVDSIASIDTVCQIHACKFCS